MSVFGVDFSSFSSSVAITRRGGVDIVLNEVGKRETITMVSIQNGERFVGEMGYDRSIRNALNTVSSIKPLIGAYINHPGIEKEKQFLTCPITSDEHGRLMFVLQYNDREELFYPEQILAMVLQKLRSYVEHTIESEKGRSIDFQGCVISIPCYYSPEQRLLINQACEIAGLKALSLANETTAAAVDYGIYRGQSLSDSEKEGIFVLIVDIGYSHTTSALMRFWKGNCRTVSRKYSKNVSCRDIDFALFTYLTKEIKDKYHLDTNLNAKTRARVMQSVSNLRYLLSGNRVAPFNVENLQDQDICIPKITRETLEDLSSSMLQEYMTMLCSTLEEGGITPKELHSCELIGGGSRIPMFKSATAQSLGRAPSFTMNATETVARGCAIIGASYSPLFRVREFFIHERGHFSILLGYYVENHKNPIHVPFIPDINRVISLFPKNKYYPFSVRITMKSQPINTIYAFIDASEDEAKELLPNGPYVLGMWRIDNRTAHNEVHQSGNANNNSVNDQNNQFIDSQGLCEYRLTMRIEPNGLLSMHEAKVRLLDETPMSDSTALPETEPTAPSPQTSTYRAEEEGSTATNTKEDGSSHPQTTPTPETTGSSLPSTAPTAAKAHKYESVNFSVLHNMGLTVDRVKDFHMSEVKMAHTDSIIMATREKKNELESCILVNRPRLAPPSGGVGESNVQSGGISDEGSLCPYVTEKDRKEFIDKSIKIENWLYNQGYDSTLEEYSKRADELQAITYPALQRKKAWEDLEACSHSFFNELPQQHKILTESIGKNAHITEGELHSEMMHLDETRKWVENRLSEVNKQSRTEFPLLRSEELAKQMADIRQRVQKLLKKEPTLPQSHPGKTTKAEEKASGAAGDELNGSIDDNTNAQGAEKENGTESASSPTVEENLE